MKSGFVFILAGLVLAPPSVRQLSAACADYRVLGRLGSTPTSAPAFDVAIGDSYIVTAEGTRGLEIFDRTNPDFPQRIAGLATPGWANSVAATGSIVAVAADASGLLVIDMSDPAHPLHVASMPQVFGYTVETAGPGRVAAFTSEGFSIIDISIPDQPRVIGSTTVPDVGFWIDKEIAIAGTSAFVAGLSGTPGGPDIYYHIVHLDIADPACPSVRSIVDTAEVMRIAADRQRVFVAWQSEDRFNPSLVSYGVQAFDFSGIHPRSCGNLELYCSPGPMCVRESALIAANYTITALSVSAFPSTLGIGEYLNNPRGMAVDGGKALIVGGSELAVFDATNAISPVAIGQCDLPGHGEAATVLGDYALVADGSYGLEMIDVSVPSQPTLRRRVDTPGTAKDVAISGQYACVADGAEGLQVVFVGDPDVARVVSSVALAGVARSVAVADGMAFVATGDGGVTCIDVSDPESPIVASTFPGLGYTTAVAALHSTIYALGLNAIAVMDYSDPRHPTIAATFPFYSPTSLCVDTAGQRLCVAGHDDSQVGGSLSLFDLTVPAAPVLLQSLNLPLGLFDVGLDGDMLYAVSPTSGVRIFQADDSGAFAYLAAMSLPGWSDAIALSGEHLYAISSEFGLVVMPRQCPIATPTYLRFLNAEREGGSIVLRWQLADAVQVFEMRLVARAGERTWELACGRDEYPGLYVARDSSEWIRTSGEITYELYVIDAANGWTLLGSVATTGLISRDADLRLTAAPNPLNPETELQFSRPRPGHVRLAIHDASGRLVELLLDEDLGAGPHRVPWRGRDNTGLPVAAGMYLARLDTGLNTRSVKLVLMK